jgi:phage FluMu protein Com
MAEKRPRPEYRNHPDMLRTLATNGLGYRKVICRSCGTHICDQAILIGEIRKQCVHCKEVNMPSFNRVGDEQSVSLAADLRGNLMHTRDTLKAVLDGHVALTVAEIDDMNALMDSLARAWYNGIFNITR